MRDQVGREIETSGEIVVIVGRDRDETGAIVGEPRHRGKDVVGGERDVMNAGASLHGDGARHLRAAALRDVQHHAHGAIGCGDAAAANQAERVGQLRPAGHAEHRAAEQDPAVEGPTGNPTRVVDARRPAPVSFACDAAVRSKSDSNIAPELAVAGTK
jgi:hypothetical protein